MTEDKLWQFEVFVCMIVYCFQTVTRVF